MADFVEICNVCVRKAIIEAAKRIINSDKACHSYSDLNFGVTFFGTQCIILCCTCMVIYRWLFFDVTSYSCKENAMVFIILLQCVICYLFKKTHFMHLQQYDENHCVYLARIGRHIETSRQNHDHAYAAYSYLFLHNLCYLPPLLSLPPLTPSNSIKAKQKVHQPNDCYFQSAL